jgi:hypothetical protein
MDDHIDDPFEDRMDDDNDSEPRLPYLTKPLIINGREIEEYIIPEDDKSIVLERMCPWDLPGLDEQRFDLHSGKLFTVRDFRVTRENDRNWLVSPYYEEGGGTVIDWMPPEWAEPDEDDFFEEEEWEESEE